MIEGLRESRGWQLLLIAALILIVPLMVDINGRIGVIRRMRQEETRLEGELAEVQAEHAALQAELEFVASDAYLEQWARIDARMTQPGEVAIIPLIAEPSAQMAPAPESSPSRTAPPLSIPEQWHRLFFDDAAAPQP
jgi:cell division protein FtsB